MIAEIMRRGETFTIIEPTNRINKKTLKKAAALSCTGKTIIPILSNDNCIINQTRLLKKYPEVRNLGILPLQQCTHKDGLCGYYDRCPITLPLRAVINVAGYAITYAKLTALYLSSGEIAAQILTTILSVDHIIFDECHELGYPETISVQIHPEIDMEKYGDVDLPVLSDVVAVFFDALDAACDAIAEIKAATPEYYRRHLAIPITSASAITRAKDISAGISSSINLMIHRDDYDLTIDDVILLKDMLLLCTEKKHIVHGIIGTKSDGGKKLRIFMEGTDTIFRSVVRKTMSHCIEQQKIWGGQVSRLWCTSGTIGDMTGVLPFAAKSRMFGDPMDTNAMFAVIADHFRTTDKGLRNRKTFERIINDIKRVVSRFGAGKCLLVVISKKWYDKIKPELKEYKQLEITWYNSDMTVGVESNRRVMIAVGMAEKPKNSMDSVALSRKNDDEDGVDVSDRLRTERVQMDTFQAWSRAKDPNAKVRSVVVALGCNAEDVRNVVKWRVNRKLEVSRVKKTTGGSRTHYGVCGDEMIGSEIRIIERGRNNDINELIEKWLKNGDTTPLTCKTFEDFFKKHKGEKMTVRDIHQGMHLSRKGVNQKDVARFLSENVDPVTKNPYIYNIGKNGNKKPFHEVKTSTLNDPVTKNPYDFQPLTKKNIKEHYSNSIIAAAIMQRSRRDDGSWRAGNHDFFGWWKRVDTRTDKLEKLYVLSDHNDYHLLIEKGRTLYWTLNFFEDSIKTQQRSKPESGQKGAVIGEYKTTIAYSLGVDIDHTDGSDVFKSKTALEAAAQFFIDRLHDIGIRRSYDVLFSGGGIYIYIHPEITVCPTPDADRMDRERWFYLLAETYNKLINNTQQQFYDAHPEYKSLVKFDALNNSKRVFKSLFSIHKKHPFACIPLDKNNPQIDFNAAHPPLSDDVLNSGIVWLSDHDITERQALINALSQYEDQVEEKLPGDISDTDVAASDTPVNVDDFPPCINTVLNTRRPTAGGTRMIGFLSAFLYQVGWSKQQALALIFRIADQFGMDKKTAERYFTDWFGKMRCPSCDKIRRTGTHYPSMYMGELKLCKPDHDCDGVYNPTRYKQASSAEVEIDAPIDECVVDHEHGSAPRTTQQPASTQIGGADRADNQKKPDRKHVFGANIPPSEEKLLLVKDAILKLGHIRGLHVFTAVELLMELPKGLNGTTVEMIEAYLNDHAGELKIERTDADRWRQRVLDA